MRTAKTNIGFIIFLSCLCFALPDHAISSSMEWVQIEKPMTPRFCSSLCYYPETGTVLLFGGNSGSTFTDDTWEWDGVKWNYRSPEHAPGEFWSSPSLLYDSLNHRMLLLGSRLSDDMFQIWEWTGTDWSLVGENASMPSGWGDFSCTYDGRRNVICVFGGYSEDAIDDLWEWDQEEWHQIPKSNPWPPAKLGSGMIYNPEIQKAVVLLEFNGQFEFWYWDGSVWENPEVSPPRPPERTAHGIVYDPARSVIILFSGNGNYDDTWEFDGDQWHEMSPPHQPSGRSNFAATWDAQTNRVMLLGGATNGGEPSGETWFYNGSDWSYFAPDPFYPPDVWSHAMAYNPTDQTAILYGGMNMGQMPIDVFQWNGAEWTVSTESTNPGPVVGHAMSYLESLDGIILYGGSNYSGSVIYNETWLYREDTWIHLTPPVNAGPRESSAMAYDSNRDRIIAFGGISERHFQPFYTVWSDETWEFDGTTWCQIVTDHHPPALAGSGAAFDSCRGVTVLFGGSSESGFYDKIWEYDGVDWTRINPATTAPGGRHGMGFTFDQHRCRVVMHGGIRNTEPGFDETWEWDGYDWYLIEPTGGRAAPYHSTAMIYDSARKCSMIYGGGREGITVETFVYRHSNPNICDQMGVTLDLSQSVFHAGDTFTCTAQVCNNTGDVLTGYPLLVLLDVFGSYFWGPTFTQEFDSYLPQYPSFPEDVTDVEVLPSFSWPSNVGSAQGIRFYAALVDPDVLILIGQLDMVEFGWE